MIFHIPQTTSEAVQFWRTNNALGQLSTSPLRVVRALQNACRFRTFISANRAQLTLNQRAWMKVSGSTKVFWETLAGNILRQGRSSYTT